MCMTTKNLAEDENIGEGSYSRCRKCEYGSSNEIGGWCNYSFMTGHCKVVVVNGRKTVAPTKDCVFFEPKKKKKRIQKSIAVTNRKSTWKPVLQVDLDGSVVNRFESVSEASKEMGFNGTGRISTVLTGKAKTAGGYKWMYANKEYENAPKCNGMGDGG